MKTDYVKKVLAIGIIFLFVVSIITPMTFGYNVRITNKKEPQSTLSGSGLMDSPWPMLNHDSQHTGRSSYGTNGKYLIEKWRFRLAGDLAYSPIIDRNGTIYICACFANGQGLDGLVQAVYPNGTEKWRYYTRGVDEGEGWIEQCSPAISEDGTIYVGDKQGYFYAIESDNGSLKWKTKLLWNIFSSPTIANDGTIYIGANYRMYALYPNGTIKWTYDTGSQISASPALDDNGIVYVSSFDGYLYAFYPNNGTLKWKTAIGGCGSSPAIDENNVIYIGGGSGFYAIYQDGSIKWRVDNSFGFSKSPSIDYDGTIYVTRSGGITWLEPVYAFDSDNGNIKWENDLELTSYTIAISNSSNIFLGADYSIDSRAYLLSPADGHTICNLPLFAEWLSAGPAIGSDGTVYFGSWDGYLHAIEVKEHAPSLKIYLKGKLGRLEVKFKNIGDVPATNVTYSVSLEAYYAYRSPKFDGFISSLGPGKIVTRNAWFFFGFDTPYISIKITAPGAKSDQISEIWGMCGPFIYH